MSVFLPICAAVAVAVQPAGTPPRPEPDKPTLTLTPQRVFADARAAYRDKPLAERIGITILQKGQTPAAATLTLRIAPGKSGDQSDAAIVIDAGDLRISIDAGHITAILNSQPATYYQADFSGPPTLSALSAALGPLPLPQLALLTAPSDDLLPAPTLHTPGIIWTPTKVFVEDLTSPIKLSGVNGDKPASISFDQRTGRLTSFSATLPPPSQQSSPGPTEPRTIELVVKPTEPGDPKSWAIDTSKRVRVGALRDLATKPAPPKSEPALPAAVPQPAEPAP